MAEFRISRSQGRLGHRCIWALALIHFTNYLYLYHKLKNWNLVEPNVISMVIFDVGSICDL